MIFKSYATSRSAGKGQKQCARHEKYIFSSLLMAIMKYLS